MNGPKESEKRMIVQRREEINEWSKREWKENEKFKAKRTNGPKEAGKRINSLNERGNKWMVKQREEKKMNSSKERGTKNDRSKGGRKKEWIAQRRERKSGPKWERKNGKNMNWCGLV